MCFSSPASDTFVSLLLSPGEGSIQEILKMGKDFWFRFFEYRISTRRALSFWRVKMAEDSNSSNFSSAGRNLLKQYTTMVPSEKVKGVSRRQSGGWVCRICTSQQHFWLGTFNSKEDAVVAYRRAALKLKVSEASRKFPLSEAIADELNFQSLHSTETVLNMIKDGSYSFCFAYYLKTRSHSPSSNKGMIYQKMFQKRLTPSDVGIMKRLVIPKKAAINFFPPIAKETDENVAYKGVPLYFYDRSMKKWKFQFCYRNNQSYLFTTGWSCFVQEKALKANDTIACLKCEGNGGPDGASTFYMILVNPGDGGNMILVNPGDGGSSSGVSSGLTNPSQQPLAGPTSVLDNGDVKKRNPETERKGIMLFGVDISSTGK